MLLIVMYFVNALGRTSEAMERFQPVLLFYYYGLVIEHGVQWLIAGVISLLAAGVVTLAVFAFERCDIYT